MIYFALEVAKENILKRASLTKRVGIAMLRFNPKNGCELMRQVFKW